MGAKPLLTRTAFVAGNCDIDMKIKVQIARDSILFEVSNFTDKAENIWVGE